MKDVTFIIKTFNRPQSVTKLVESCLKHFPNTPIIICDDGNICAEFSHPKVKVLDDMPFDSGTSQGRNLLVSKVYTKYFILLDDDFLINIASGVSALHTLIEKYNDYDMIGGWLSNQPNTKKLKGIFSEEGEGIYKVNRTVTKGEITPVDFILNYFIAKTDSFKNNNIKWDDEMKTGEHTLFFYNVWKNHDLKIGFTESAYIYHDTKHHIMDDYMKYRNRAVAFMENALKRYDIKKITSIDNKVYEV